MIKEVKILTMDDIKAEETRLMGEMDVRQKAECLEEARLAMELAKTKMTNIKPTAPQAIKDSLFKQVADATNHYNHCLAQQ